MPRPKVQLISRRKALQAALDIIDSKGLNALSIRGIGEALHVNGSSLYHHFKDKDDILAGVTQLALAEVPVPRSRAEIEPVWLAPSAYRMRQALMRHPQLIPLVLQQVSLRDYEYDDDNSVARLMAGGVELEAITPMLEAFELIAIASAMQAAHKPPKAVGIQHRRAKQARGLTRDEVFEIVCSAVADAIESETRARMVPPTADEPPRGLRGMLASTGPTRTSPGVARAATSRIPTAREPRSPRKRRSQATATVTPAR
jgi:TetR/AcrR family tetracycline transcriptional repressor